MKIKSLMYVLMGTMLVVACTDSSNEERIVNNGGEMILHSMLFRQGLILQLAVLFLLRSIQVSLWWLICIGTQKIKKEVCW